MMEEAAKRINDLYAALLQAWLREQGLPTYESKQINGHKLPSSLWPTGERLMGGRLNNGAAL